MGHFWKIQRGGGSYEKSLPWVGYGYYLEPHNYTRKDTIMTSFTRLRVLECTVLTQLTLVTKCAKRKFESLKAQNSRTHARCCICPVFFYCW